MQVEDGRHPDGAEIPHEKRLPHILYLSNPKGFDDDTQRTDPEAREAARQKLAELVAADQPG